MISRRYIIAFCVTLSFCILVWSLGQQVYLSSTKEVPLSGGMYTEGVVGQPKFLNPVFAVSDVDQDITSLVFSGLVKVNDKGEFEPDLAESWKVVEGSKGRQYDFFLKENISWHDGQLFTSDDVYFTIALLQNPETQSPLKQNYEGLKVEKITTHQVRFTLPSPYAFFLNSMTIGILPYHVLRDLPPGELLAHSFNLTPIGTGPFQFKKLITKKKEQLEYSSILLTKNPNYYMNAPYLDSVALKFYAAHADLLNAYQRREIDGISSISALDLPDMKYTSINLHYIRIPEMKAVFFNLRSDSPVNDPVVRNVLNMAVNKQGLVDDIFNKIGFPISGPLLNPLTKEQTETGTPQTAALQAMLEEAGWHQTGEDEVRKKNDKPLSFSLVTDDSMENLKIVNYLQETWKKLGVEANVQIFYQMSFIQDYVQPRNFEAALLKVNLGSDPDQYPLWHSSQSDREGSFNFSGYKRTDVDELLEDARRLDDAKLREEKYQLFEKAILHDNPAIFLYSPYYIYGVDKNFKGIETDTISQPSERFSSVSNWYLNTKRVPK
ncbi:MAG: ABC transporter substrate-binding protein [bacterium]